MARDTITIPNPPVSVDAQTEIPIPITGVPGDPSWFTGSATSAPGTTYTLITVSGLALPTVRNIVYAKVSAKISGELQLKLNGAIIDSDHTSASKHKAQTDLQAPRQILAADTIEVVFVTASWVQTGGDIRGYLVVGDVP